MIQHMDMDIDNTRTIMMAGTCCMYMHMYMYIACTCTCHMCMYMYMQHVHVVAHVTSTWSTWTWTWNPWIMPMFHAGHGHAMHLRPGHMCDVTALAICTSRILKQKRHRTFTFLFRALANAAAPAHAAPGEPPSPERSGAKAALL